MPLAEKTGPEIAHTEPQKILTSREIISVRSVKSVWDLKLRFPQIFEDEGGLASGIVMLARIIA